MYAYIDCCFLYILYRSSSLVNFVVGEYSCIRQYGKSKILFDGVLLQEWL